MTDLIRELEAVVAKMDHIKANGWAIPTDELVNARADIIDFVHDHHAEIAEALRDARRYRAMVDITQTGDEANFIMVNGYGDLASEEIDAAIDAMHNSAGDEG